MSSRSSPSMALITGGSRGIGLELARCFARDGHGVILAARHEEELQRAAAALRAEGAGRVATVAVDLSRPEGPARLFGAVEELGLAVDALVINASAGMFADFAHDTALHAELSIVQLNCVAALHLSRLFAKAMAERGRGRILFISSAAARGVSHNRAVYASTKAFLRVFAAGLRGELKDKGVSVTALLPDAGGTVRAQASAADVPVGKAMRADPATLAAVGYRAMMRGRGRLDAPLKSRWIAALSRALLDPSFPGRPRPH